MPTIAKVPAEGWAALYQAAAEFRDVEPWDWMEDIHLFAVQNPEKPEAGYCCVLGNGGEVFALCVYLGAEGLHTYRKMASGEAGPERPEALCGQKFLMASFEDRSELAKEDKAVIKALSLKFRGSLSWPCFRSYLPNCAPWFVDAAEARFLTVALRQARDVALRFRANRELLTPPKPGFCFTRLPVPTGDAVRWEDRWTEPEPWQEPPVTPAPVNEVKVALARKASPNQAGTWELLVTVTPGVVMDRERPYIPRLALIADRGTGFLYAAETLDPWKYREFLVPKLLELITRTGIRPDQIHVRERELLDLLGPNAQALGVCCVLRERLPVAEGASAMLGSLGER